MIENSESHNHITNAQNRDTMTDSINSNNSALQCNFENCSKSNEYETYLFPTFYGIIFSVGLVGNLISLGVIVQLLRNRNVLGVYLLNLCISDLVYISTLPVWAAYTHDPEGWTFGITACDFVGFFFSTNVYTTIVFLSCISSDRFLAVVYPLRSRGLRTMKVAILVCVVVWLIILGSHSVLLIHQELFVEAHGIKLCYEKYPTEPWLAQLNYFRVFVVFLIPLVLLLVSYSMTIKVIHRSSSLEVRRKRKITGLLLSMIVIFVVSYLPYHIILLVQSHLNYSEDCSCEVYYRVRTAYRIIFAFASISSALDPILNIFISNSVKQDIMKDVVAIQHWAARLFSSDCLKPPRKNFLKTVTARVSTDNYLRNHSPMGLQGNGQLSQSAPYLSSS
ncbi:G-protein coupled receptor 4-like isoform X1 [Acipenser ruthenus]|uniref:G-protein coupled receptor 4-like isoform X1 n=1 Tax=Acipenser ruthenus TaxID=7906 RepID=UPI00145B0D5B|nr:G-protein coupled receptor 4-like isoform X1 [Acipenser ruthenus]